MHATILRTAASVVIDWFVSRTFTLEEAKSTLPKLRPHLARSVQMWVRLSGLARALGVEAAKIREPYDAKKLAGRPDLREELDQARLFASVIADELAVLEAMGAVVHEDDRSLIGLRTVVDGEREVLFCYRLGEGDIEHYREPGAGLEGRKPIEGHRFFRSRQLRAPTE